MTIYGFAMLDIGHDFKQINPNWSDTMRVTKLPSFENQFGEDNSTFAGRASEPARRQGVDADQPRRAEDDLRVRAVRHRRRRRPDDVPPAPRVRRARPASAPASTWSPFMDPDVFPNSLEYWGPTGMVFFRNVQFRWMPIRATTNLTLALERPGASGDAGVYADRIELQNIKGRFPVPDLSGAYTLRREVGLRPGGRHAARINVGRHARRPVRPERQRHGLGLELQLEPQVRRREGRPPPAARVSARASRTT